MSFALNLAGGNHPQTVFSSLFEGTPILAFLTKKDATSSLRSVCKELRAAVDHFVWRCSGEGCTEIIGIPSICKECGVEICDECTVMCSDCERTMCVEHMRSDGEGNWEYCSECVGKFC